MRALLVQSPATSPWVPRRQWETPSLGLASIAAQIQGHEVRVADMVVWRRAAARRYRRLLRDFQPQVVGFSAMSFQYDSTLRFAHLTREHDPAIRTLLGGYHASLLAEEIAASPHAVYWDFLLRGEGDTAFGELLHCLQRGVDPGAVAGLSHRDADGRWRHNPPRPLEDLARLRIPARGLRLTRGFHTYFRPADVVETSRGCLHRCAFCSISQLYGRSFRTFPLERVIADIEDAYRRGARQIVIADDNITHDIDRLEALCRRIIALKLKDLVFFTQASPVGFARRPGVVKLMVQAGVRSVFLGIEAGAARSLRALHKPNTVELIRRGVEALQRENVIVVAGIINGLPHDDAGSIRDNYAFVRSLGITSVMDQLLTPYPRTPVRRQMLERGLVENLDDYRWYDGYFANARTETLGARELNFLRWKLRREVIGIWRPTRADWEHFAAYSRLWEYGGRHVVGLTERLLERLLGQRGRYALQMRHYLRLNDFGIELPGDRPGYHPVHDSALDPYDEGLSALLHPLLATRQRRRTAQN